jgi:hypothetical protein
MGSSSKTLEASVERRQALGSSQTQEASEDNSKHLEEAFSEDNSNQLEEVSLEEEQAKVLEVPLRGSMQQRPHL